MEMGSSFEGKLEMVIDRIRLLQENENAQQVNDILDDIMKSCDVIYVEYSTDIQPSYIIKNVIKEDGVIYQSSEDEKTSGCKCLEYIYEKKQTQKIELRAWLRAGAAESEEKTRQIHFMLVCLSEYVMKNYVIQQMQKNYFYDYATGIPNADGFIMQGNKLVGQGKIKDYNAFYWNIHNLKVANQRFGTKVGDQIILAMARMVQGMLKEGEIVGRLGGDNFVALVYKENAHKLIYFLEHMKVKVCGDEVQYPVEESDEIVQKEALNGNSIILDVRSACGVYPIEDTIVNMSQVMQKVSVAYRAARDLQEKNTIIYNEEMEKRHMLAQKVLVDFLPAIRDGEFHVYYQPKVDVQTRSMVGAEALARWNKNGTIIYPGDFIAALENTQNICTLDFYMLEQVCKDLRRWIDERKNPVRVSVNFSRKHLANRYFVSEILLMLSQYKIPHRYIEIEITETATSEEQIRLEEVFSQLHDEGIHVSIDDFGTGYSSLNMIRRLPVDILKIDRSFISEATNNHKDRLLLKNIIQMADELGINIIMEGVETEEQMQLLEELHCTLVQGFYFDRALSVEKFDEKLMSKKY